MVEGITSYYGDLLVRRAGFSTAKEYLKGLSKAIESVQSTPGRAVQSLAESSFDAWIKLYRRDENTANTGISYYTKGELAAFLLDARIRRATGGKRSLDDALRLAYQRFSGERGYLPEEFRKVLEEVAGTDLGPWLARAVEATAGARLHGGPRLVRPALRPGARRRRRASRRSCPPPGWGRTPRSRPGG